MRPVNKAARVGAHRAVVWNRLYLRPFPASRSAVGVAHGPPKALEAAKPTSSSRITSTLGAPAGGCRGSIAGNDAYQTRTDEVVLTALVQTFAQWTGTRALLLDLESYGREEPRADLDLSRTLGWCTPVFPALLDLGAVEGPKEALVSVKEQLRRVPDKGVNYGVLRYLSGDTQIAGQLDALPQPQVSFNYLGQLDDILSESAVLGAALEFSAPRRSARGVRRHLLEISASVSAGRLQLAWTYSPNRHRHSTIADLAAGSVAALRALILHCQSPDAGAYTPSDFAEFKWNDQYFEDIAEEISKAIS